MPTLLLVVGLVGLTTPTVINVPSSTPIEAVSPIQSLKLVVVPPPVVLGPIGLISKISSEQGISSTTLYNLANSESSLKESAVGDKGCSLGIVQINTCMRNVSHENALDPEFALNYAAEAIKNDTDDAWTSCNCYSYIKANFLPNLPHMADIMVNTSIPHKGEVAIFFYTDKQTGQSVKHVAYVLDDKGTIQEANKTRCLTDTRTIHSGDPFLAGYWDPTV